MYNFKTTPERAFYYIPLGHARRFTRDIKKMPNNYFFQMIEPIAVCSLSPNAPDPATVAITDENRNKPIARNYDRNEAYYEYARNHTQDEFIIKSYQFEKWYAKDGSPCPLGIVPVWTNIDGNDLINFLRNNYYNTPNPARTEYN